MNDAYSIPNISDDQEKLKLQEYLIEGTLVEDREYSSGIRRLRRADCDQTIIYFEDHPAAKASGGKETMEAITKWIQSKKLAIQLIATGSLGFTSAQPVIGIQVPGRNRLFFSQVQSYEVVSILESVLAHQVNPEKLLGQWGDSAQTKWPQIPFLNEFSFFKGQQRRLMGLNGIIDPSSMMEYIAWGGYHTFARSIRYFSHESVFQQVQKSNILGRSGSGFPAHLKWQKALATPAKRRILICNADESDPGAFMHRILMEGNPHLLIEGIMLAAYALGAEEAIIHTRNRYAVVVERMEVALKNCKNAGLIGTDIFSSGYSLEIKLNKGPGAYVTGEETALIASLEGKRGMPRPKPPYPAEIGLNGHPTIVHNVETLAHVAIALKEGADVYRKSGTADSPGTKLYSISGKTAHSGVLELPFGYPIEKLLTENLSCDQDQIKAVLVGGPAGRFIPENLFDMTLDHEAFRANGFEMGSGSMVLLDKKSCILDMISHLAHFIQKESCGKCIPCREGSKRMSGIIDLIVSRGEGSLKHEALQRFKGVTELSSLAKVMSDTSLCGLGKGAANPLNSAIHYFNDEIEEHVFDRTCRAGVCRGLRVFFIDQEACTGCYICFNKCPEQAIAGSPRQPHVIIGDRCTGCGICYEVCKFNAVVIQ